LFAMHLILLKAALSINFIIIISIIIINPLHFGCDPADTRIQRLQRLINPKIWI